jgi:VCBS repeat-containing protein
VEKAMLMDTRYLESGCQSLIAYYEQKGRKDLVKKYVKKLDDFEDVKDLAREERYHVKPSDQFEPATLPSELLEKLRSQIADYTDVDEALIARKQVQHLPEFPHYVIAIKPKFSFNADERNIELINALNSQLQFEESFCVTVIDGSKKKIEHKLKEISDEPLYSRKASKN